MDAISTTTTPEEFFTIVVIGFTRALPAKENRPDWLRTTPRQDVRWKRALCQLPLGNEDGVAFVEVKPSKLEARRNLAEE